MRSLLVALLLVAPSFSASSGGGTVEFAFLRNLVPARDAAFCNAWVPGGGDLSALGYNPAGIARSTAPVVEVGGRIHTDWTGSVQLAGAYPALDGILAARLDEQAIPSITGLDQYGDTTGRIHRPSQTSLVVGFGEPLGERLAWGIGMRLVRENLDIDNSQAFGITVNLGAVLQPGTRRFLYWIQMEDLGTKLSGQTAAERDYGPMPLAFAGGVRYTTGVRGLNLFTEIRKPMESEVNLRPGFEYKANEWVELRAALRTDLPEVVDGFRTLVLQRDIVDEPPSSDLRWSLGGTVRHENLSLDYAFQWWSLQDPAHYINVSWDFSSYGKRKPSSTSNQGPQL